MGGIRQTQGVLSRLEENPYLWLAPLGFVLVAFYLYPMLEVVRLSFTDATFLTPARSYSLRNYWSLLAGSDNFYSMLGITFKFTFVSLIFQVLLGLGIALLVDRGLKRGLPGSVLIRAIVLSTWIIPGIAIGVIWQLMLSSSSFGVANYLLQSIGMKGKIPFLYDPQISLVSVTVANIWRGTAFSMILQFAGLQRIPEQLYEAAKVDGASSLQRFCYVTLPQLRPFLFTNLSLATIYTFNTFDMIIAMTGGGPGMSTEVLSLYTYHTVFDSLNLGRGAAVAVLLLLINFMMAVVYYRAIQREAEVE